MSLVETTPIKPDGVYDPGTGWQPAPGKHALDPCPYCGTRQHDAPEGVKADGTPVLGEEYCHKCGFRPGVNQAADIGQLNRAFEAFKAWQAQQMAETLGHPTIAPANQNDVQALQEALAAATAESARLRAELGQGNPQAEGQGGSV